MLSDAYVREMAVDANHLAKDYETYAFSLGLEQCNLCGKWGEAHEVFRIMEPEGHWGGGRACEKCINANPDKVGDLGTDGFVGEPQGPTYTFLHQAGLNDFTIEDELRRRSGQECRLVRWVREPEEKYDAEVLPMVEIRFADGFETAAWPEEVEYSWHCARCGCGNTDSIVTNVPICEGCSQECLALEAWVNDVLSYDPYGEEEDE